MEHCVSGHTLTIRRIPTPFLLRGQINHSRPNPFLETPEEVEARILYGDPNAKPPQGILAARG